MVEVFKTNIQDKTTAKKIMEDLYKFFPTGKINFDLDDCDKILRIEGENVIADEVANILKRKGFFCKVLE